MPDCSRSWSRAVVWKSSAEASIDGGLPEQFFLDILRRGFSDDEARHQLDLAIDWGRYGELYDYDAKTGMLWRERVKEPAPTA
jgi:NitT/TauT family transport system ATP-binding protein